MNTPSSSASPSHEVNVLDVLDVLGPIPPGDDACGACGGCLTPDLASTASKDHLICYYSSSQELLVPNKDLYISHHLAKHFSLVVFETKAIRKLIGSAVNTHELAHTQLGISMAYLHGQVFDPRRHDGELPGNP